MKGRKPLPHEVHEKKGTLRKDRHGSEPVRGAGGRPPMPPGLNDRAKRAWKTICDDLAASGLLDRSDAGVIEAAAVLWSRAREARAAINREGVVITGANGTSIAHPAWKIEREAWAAFRQLADELGLTILSRSRLGIALARSNDRGGSGGKPAAGSIASKIGDSPRLKALQGGRQ